MFTLDYNMFKKKSAGNDLREKELIVSLTTIPERIHKVHICINTLLNQSVKPDRVILWICEDDFEKVRIPILLKMLVKRGLEIRRHYDLRSYLKIIPALKCFPDALIVTADDDVRYPVDWLKDLYNAYKKEPEYIHCHRAHLIKYNDSGNVLPYNEWVWQAGEDIGPSLDLFPTGVGGVLYAPGHLGKEVLNEKCFMENCQKADDVWLKAMSLMNKTECKKVKSKCFSIKKIKIKNNRTLSEYNVDMGGNDTQLNNINKIYNVFKG